MLSYFEHGKYWQIQTSGVHIPFYFFNAQKSTPQNDCVQSHIAYNSQVSRTDVTVAPSRAKYSERSANLCINKILLSNMWDIAVNDNNKTH